MTTTLVAGATREEQFARVLDGLSAFAGRPLTVDEDVFESERATGDRNRAIAYLMRSAGLLDEDVEQQIANYFRQCSIVVTAQDLAVMTATLANAGVNPLTGVEVIPRHVVASVLTVMATCGMYDSSGEWLYRVGLPAKSGVSGAVAAVLPGQLGLAAHSPRLDPQGNSVRGVAACERISERLGLHLLLPGERVRSGLRRSYRADTARSRRLRDQGQRDVLDAHGTSIVVYELGGDEAFAAVEPLVRVVLDDDDAQWVVIDMRRVTRIDTAALTLLDGLIAQLTSAGTAVGIVEPRAQGPRIAVRDLDHALPRFPDADAALEWCETQLLHEHGLDNALPEEMIPLAQQDLLLGLPAEIVTAIEERVVTKVFHAGTVVFEEGDESDGLYFVGAGQVAADVRLKGRGGRRRLSTIASGSSFGELALVDGRPRSTRIVAIEPTICFILSPEAFDELWTASPDACASLALAIARSLSDRLRYSTATWPPSSRPEPGRPFESVDASEPVMTGHCRFVYVSRLPQAYVRMLGSLNRRTPHRLRDQIGDHRMTSRVPSSSPRSLRGRRAGLTGTRSPAALVAGGRIAVAASRGTGERGHRPIPRSTRTWSRSRPARPTVVTTYGS